MRPPLSLLALALSLAGCAAVPTLPDGRAAFVAMNAMVGDWVAPSKEGPTYLTYRRVANGSALIEEMRGHELGPQQAPLMVSVYHMDGNVLAMTHFCGQGNQPRMHAVELVAGRMRFAEFATTNLASADASRMVRVEFAWTDADHFTQVWTTRIAGSEVPWSFAFQRMPTPTQPIGHLGMKR